MNKHEFLTELRANVHMLDDDEQVDIINEYAQHIDMKVQSGMSESEAIDDFGPLDELIGEILAAYHVKAIDKTAVPESARFINGGKQMAGAAMDATKQGCSKLKDGATRALDKVKDAAHTAAEAHKRQAELHPDAPSPLENTARFLQKTGHSCIHAAGGLWGTVLRLSKTLLRWCWNAFAACIVFCCLSGSVCLLFVFGFCLVLLLQGYPLGGITLASLGATVSLICLSLLLIRFAFRSKQSPLSPPPVNDTTGETTQPLPISFPPSANEVM